ncbi:MAG: GntR family transcriptional regulator [Pirellulaceae bacterium]
MTIAQQIESELKTHIVAGEAPPYPLTLSGIAGYYGVSLMPVRAAVDALVERRYLVRQDNRRLVVNRNRKRRQAARRTAPSPTAEPPEEVLTRQVIHLSLLGRESYLREEATAEQLGIGRTVVRRIFSRLAGQRMLEHVPRCGWRVRPYREQDMHDYLEIRETLELRALELARRRFEEQHLRELLIANTPDAQGRPRLDNRLHQYWIRLADNRYLLEFFAENGVYFQALFDRAVMNDRIVARRAAEHRRILKAILARDWSSARDALSRHIRGQRTNVAHMFNQLSGEPTK